MSYFGIEKFFNCKSGNTISDQGKNHVKISKPHIHFSMMAQGNSDLGLDGVSGVNRVYLSVLKEPPIQPAKRCYINSSA